MKKRFLSVMASVVILLALAGCLVACRGDKNDENGNADVTAVALSDCTFIYDDSLPYDGTERKLKITVKYSGETLFTVPQDGISEDVTVAYSDNIAVGTASVTLTAKDESKKVTGAKTLTFTVRPGQRDAENYADLNTYADDPNYAQIYLRADITVPEDGELTIGENTTVYCQTHALYIKGKITNKGNINARVLKNYGEITNTGKISFAADTKLVNYGTINNDAGRIELANSTSKYFYSSTVSNVFRSVGYSDGNTKIIFLEDCTVTLDESSVAYDGTAKTPAVTVKYEGFPVSLQDLQIDYSDNINVGTATITVSGKDEDRYYGDKSIHFEIVAVAKRCSNGEELNAALADENYAEIIMLLNGKFAEGFTVPQGKTVYIAEYSGSFNKNITNYGTIVISDGVTLRVNGELVNNGTMTVNGRFELYNGRLVNNGSLLNNGIICQLYSDYTAPEFVFNNAADNYGEIYANSNVFLPDKVNNIEDGALYIRKNLSEEGVFSLTESVFTYSPAGAAATGVFCDGAPEQGNISVIQWYVGASSDIPEGTLPINIGCVNYKVVIINDLDKKYYGEVTAQFEIVPGVAHVGTGSELTAAISDNNYSGIVIDGGEIRLGQSIGGKTLTVGEDATLCVCIALTVNKTFTNNGTIFCETTDSATNKAKILLMTGGELINNGTIYFNGAPTCEVTGDGTVVERKYIGDVDCSYTQNIPLHEQKPADITLTDGEILTLNTDYKTIFYTAEHIGPATFKVQADRLSEKYWGQASYDYSLTPGIKTDVTGMDSLKNLLLHPDDWERIVLGYTTLNFNSAVTIPKWLLLDARKATIENISAKITIDGELWTNGTRIPAPYYDEESNGTLAVYVGEYSQLRQFTVNQYSYADKIVLSNDIENPVGSDPACVTNSLTGHNLTLDLNGHEVPFLTLKALSGDIYVESSAEERGVIGYRSNTTGLNGNDGIYALVCDISANRSIYLWNLKVYGMTTSERASSTQYYKNGNLEAFDCEFITSEINVNMAPVFLTAPHSYTFDGCSMTGYCGLRANGGDTVLNGCYLHSMGSHKTLDGIGYGNAISVWYLYKAAEINTAVTVSVLASSELVSDSGYSVEFSAKQVPHNASQVTLSSSCTYNHRTSEREYYDSTKFSSSPFNYVA